MFIVQSQHCLIIVAVVAVLVWFAYSHGYFGGAKAVISKVSGVAAVPMAFNQTAPVIRDGCHDLVNGAAVDCPTDQNFNKAACLQGQGPCACWT